MGMAEDVVQYLECIICLLNKKRCFLWIVAQLAYNIPPILTFSRGDFSSFLFRNDTDTHPTT